MNIPSPSTTSILFFALSCKKINSNSGIVATAKLNSHTTDAVQHQYPPVYEIGLADLENSNIDWATYDADKNQVQLKPKKELRPHQIDAVTKVLDVFKTVDRGKMVMACGESTV